ncbi:MAG TPA: chromate transporter [Acetobacteraceae bacterium]|nr:chromate transporter [Acetobacteraceae bacterium]
MREAPPPAPTCADLFLGFLTTGLCGFGGVLPWARRMVVERRRWLSAAEFTDLLGLCQFLPGPNVINLSVALGARFHGVRGSAAAFAGLMSAPTVIVIALGFAYHRLAAIPIVAHAFVTLSAAASALVLATAIKIATPLRERPIGALVGLATFAAVAWLRWPLPLVIVGAVPVSALLTWAVEARATVRRR